MAWLAAEGRTNREIGQALFVTRRTVETHLGAAFRKLGIASRAELPAWRAETSGWVHDGPPPGAAAR